MERINWDNGNKAKLMEKTFKQIVNEIGEKFAVHGIDEIYMDYQLLCILNSIVKQIIDNTIRDELHEHIDEALNHLVRKKFIIEEKRKLRESEEGVKSYHG